MTFLPIFFFSEPAAGLVGLMSACLMLSHAKAVPLLHLRTPNPDVVHARPRKAAIPRGAVAAPCGAASESASGNATASSFSWQGSYLLIPDTFLFRIILTENFVVPRVLRRILFWSRVNVLTR